MAALRSDSLGLKNETPTAQELIALQTPSLVHHDLLRCKRDIGHVFDSMSKKPLLDI